MSVLSNSKLGKAVGEAGSQGKSRRLVLYMLRWRSLGDFKCGHLTRQLDILVWNSRKISRLEM